MRTHYLNLKTGPRPRLKREYAVLGCPMDRHRATWCQGLCRPLAGRGTCGRIAPHAMIDRHRRAIAAYKARRGEPVPIVID